MGKYAKYTKKYNKEWEQLPCFSGWLEKASDLYTDKGEAFCKLCRVASLRSHKTDLVKHSKTNVHRSRADSLIISKQPNLSSFGIKVSSDHSKIQDLKLAMYIATLTSIKSIDHLSELLKSLDTKKNVFSSLELHRTKCSMLIRNVIAPTFLKELIEDIGTNPYSIILDESTDIGTHKYMAFCVRYYSVSMSDVITNFLGFVQIERATAKILRDVFLDFLKQNNLHVQALIGIGTDGASNLCGKNKSLFTLLKDIVPNIQLLKCVCHSFNTCAANACLELTSSLEFLIRESRSWFSYSSLRQLTYKVLFEALYEGKKPPRLAQLSTTRWLSWYSCVKAVLSQWLPLKTHFNIISNGPDKCYTSRILSDMFEDETHLLYLIFLKPILYDVTQVNLVFQSTNVDLSKAYSDMKSLLVSLIKRILKPLHIRNVLKNCNNNSMITLIDLESLQNILRFPDAHLPFNCVDFGIKFQAQARISIANKTLSKEQVDNVMQRSANFIFCLCREMVQRFPNNVTVMEKLGYILPKNCFDNELRVNFSDLPLELATTGTDKDYLESQWRKLGTLKLDEVLPGKCVSEISLIECWTAISKIKTATGEAVFKELSDFAFRIIILPVSNAVVERIFSIMNTTKTKLRNRMSQEMLVALIRIKTHMNIKKQCCTTFTTTKQMINTFNSSMYSTSSSTEEKQNAKETEDDLFDVFQLFGSED